MPDERHFPSIPVPTTEVGSIHRTLMAMKEVLELLTGTRGGQTRDDMEAVTVRRMSGMPLRMASFPQEELPLPASHPNAAVLALGPTGVRLLVSDGTHWRNTDGTVFVP